GGGLVGPRPTAMARNRYDLACALVFRGAGAGLAGSTGLGCLRAWCVAGLGIRQHQDRQLRPVAADIPDRCPPDVPVLRQPGGPGIPAVAADVAAGRLLAAVARSPAAGAVSSVRLVVAGRPAAVGVDRDDAVALVAAWQESGPAVSAVHRSGMAAAGICTVFGAEHQLRDDGHLLAGARSGPRIVYRFLRQHPDRDGDPGDPGACRATAGDVPGG